MIRPRGVVMTCTEARLRLLEFGYEPTPDTGKQTFLLDWQSRQITSKEILRLGDQVPECQQHRHPHHGLTGH